MLLHRSVGNRRALRSALQHASARRDQGRGKEWAEQELGLSVEIVHRSPKPEPEEVLRMWAKEWFKEGRNIDLEELFPRHRGFEVLHREGRWWNALLRGSLTTAG